VAPPALDPTTGLRGLRVLVVEDEPIVSLALQDMLADLECDVVGTAARLETALKLAHHLAFDIAVLDINLGGKSVDPVAKVIAERGLPVVFATGYGRDSVPSHAPELVLEKPYELVSLRRALSQALMVRNG
jgi:CheY-like chemotaxis protein